MRIDLQEGTAVLSRPRSAYQVKTRTGRSAGVVITGRDRQRIADLSRWYSLSAEHLARREMPPETWNPALTETSDGSPLPEFDKKVYAIKRRLAKLAGIETAGSQMGPPVSGSLISGFRVGWFTTSYGATIIDSPWAGRSSINPQIASHAWMAADVGMQIEALGYRVLSERELGSKTDKHGSLVETHLDSSVIGSTGNSVSKKPDLAVLSPDERTFMAIEVEKWKDRAMSSYTEKLRAYDDNSAVGRVWYLCGSENVANRVAQAAEKVFGDRNFPLRIRVCPSIGSWDGINGLERDESLLADLKEFS